MRKVIFTLFALLVLFAGESAFGQDNALILKWKTSSSDLSIPIEDGYDYDFSIDWDNDGVYDETNVTSSVSHNYGNTASERVIRIKGKFPYLSRANKANLLEIKQWGTIEWAPDAFIKLFNKNDGFINAVITATDAPNLSKVTSLVRMCLDNKTFNYPLNHWDVSNVTDLSYAFWGAETFNQDLNNWDVSNVTDMYGLFREAKVFNGDISSWNMSNVTNTGAMFYEAKKFNGDISSWDVSKVTSMGEMFTWASSFNGDISGWDISSLTFMWRTFYFARSFNCDLSSWDVSKVTKMVETFAGASMFKADLSSWDVSKVRDMRGMFYHASRFNSDLSSWDVSKVTNMREMFAGAGDFNCDVSNWNVKGVYDFTFMFRGVEIPTSTYDKILINWSKLGIGVYDPIVKFDAGNSYYSEKGEAARQKLITDSKWVITDKGSAPKIEGEPFIMTIKPSEYNSIYLSAPDTYSFDFSVDWDNDGTYDEYNITETKIHSCMSGDDATIRIGGEFPVLKISSNINPVKNIQQWGDIKWKSFERIFYSTDGIKSTATDTPDLSKVENMSLAFGAADNFNMDISEWDVSNVKNMYATFFGTTYNPDISKWNVSNVTNMKQMFYKAFSFTGDISKWNVSNVTDMFAIFGNAYVFNSDISSWNVSKVTNMSYAFYRTKLFNQNLNKWNVSAVENMSGMFCNTDAFNSNINDWDVSEVQNMESMFESAKVFNQDLNNWDISSVNNIKRMFRNAVAFNGDVSSWDVSKITSMDSMFMNAASFNGNITDWKVKKVSSMVDMFKGVTIPTETYDQILINWSKLNLQENVKFHAGNSHYSAKAKEARDILINRYNWEITDLGMAGKNIHLTTPNGGESIRQNSTFDITWTHTNVTGNIKIELLKGTEAPVTIAENIDVATGKYSWTVGADIADNYSIKITLADDNSITDKSDATFAVVDENTKQLTLTAPNGGESVKKGSTFNITWTLANLTGKIKIVLLNADANMVILTEDVDITAGSYTWTADAAVGDKYYIKVVSVDDNNIRDNSDEYFSIVDANAKELTLTAPNGGESVKKGSTFNITWTSANITGNVKIELLKGTDNPVLITDNVDVTTGLYAWTVDTEARDNYSVKITSVDDNTISDNSDAVFSVVESVTKELKLTSPKGGEQIKKGSTFTITWTSANITGNIKIELLKDSGNPVVIADNIDVSAGSYEWSVNTDAGDNYSIKITSATDNNFTDKSTATFSIVTTSAIDNLSAIVAKIYPNPVKDILNIELPTTGSYRVTIFNTTGDIVTQKTASSVNTTIDMSVYNSGIYIIKITTGNRSYTGKIVKR
jgi:surface protein